MLIPGHENYLAVRQNTPPATRRGNGSLVYVCRWMGFPLRIAWGRQWALCLDGDIVQMIDWVVLWLLTKRFLLGKTCDLPLSNMFMTYTLGRMLASGKETWAMPLAFSYTVVHGAEPLFSYSNDLWSLSFTPLPIRCVCSPSNLVDMAIDLGTACGDATWAVSLVLLWHCCPWCWTASQ